MISSNRSSDLKRDQLPGYFNRFKRRIIGYRRFRFLAQTPFASTVHRPAWRRLAEDQRCQAGGIGSGGVELFFEFGNARVERLFTRARF
ncbi:MAG: hypothetical protein PVG51_12230 [Desulfosarcina sp.]|jgi:hypothetical protein